MGMMKEFREFAIKGNVIDLAVGVIIGAAFSKIVDSVVSDLIMPVVGLVFGKLDFSNLFVVLGTVPAGTAMTLDALKKAGVPVLAYGSFITVAVNFFILAFIIFLMIQQVNRLKRSNPEPAPAPAATPEEVARVDLVVDHQYVKPFERLHGPVAARPLLLGRWVSLAVRGRGAAHHRRYFGPSQKQKQQINGAR